MKLETINVRKSFVDADRRLSVIEGLKFSFPESGSVAIVGRSGVGKSTLLHLLAGLERPDSGEILIGGTDITKLSSDEITEFRGKNIGVIFQFHHLMGDFTAWENVALPLTIQGMSEGEARLKAESVLKRVGLGSRLEHSPGELSGGESQRVAIARALVGRPGVVVADEPTGNLDVKTAEEVGALLREVQREERMLLITVTHSHDLARSMDLVYEMMPGGELKLIQG